MVQFIPARDDWAHSFRQAGQGASEGYMNRSDENALRRSLMNLGANPSARQILDAVTNTKTYSPQAKQQALSNYLGVEQFEELKRKAQEQEQISKAKNEIASFKEIRAQIKEENDRKSVKGIVNQLELPEEQKESLGESLTLGAAEDLLKDQLKPKKDSDLTPFDRSVQNKNAEEYINLTKEIPKIESTLGDIAYARQLSDDLGVKGVVTGALGISGKAKELENVSFTLMEPIIKMFNPSGPIAQQKLKMIQDKYAIKATDAPWTKKAKLDSLERFAKQALNRANQKLAMIKKYHGNPPETVLDQFDKESDTLSDAMIDYDLIGEEAKDEGLPDPSQFTGKTISSPEGKKFQSDGTRWVKK